MFLQAPEAGEPAGAPGGTIADAVAPNGVLPGDGALGLGNPRTMPASENPNLAALQYVTKIYNGQIPISVTMIKDPASGLFYATMPDGTVIAFRSAGQAGAATLPTRQPSRSTTFLLER
jgi:hypothetical protein